MTTITLLVLAAAFSLGLATWLRIPSGPLVIGAGIALTVVGAPLDGAMVRGVLLLGATFLVFVVGTELDPQRVGAQRAAAIRVAAARMAVLAAGGLTVGRLVGLDWLEAAYLTLALSASSMLLVTDLLRRRQQFFEPFGRLVLGVLRVQDFAVVIALSGLALATATGSAALLGAAGLAGLLAATAVVTRWVGPYALLRLRLDQEQQLLFVLGTLFLFAGAAHYTNLPLAAGAFFAGAALARFPVRGLVSGHIASFSDFFVAVFYVALGAAARMPSREELWLEGLFVAAVVLLVPPILLWFARREGLTLRSAIETVALLAQCGELSLIVGMVGLASGHLTEGTFGVIIGVVVVTTAVAPLLSADSFTWRLVHWYPTKRADAGAPPEGHVLVIGCGDSTRPLIDEWTARGEPVVVIDDDPGVVAELREAGARAVRGDGADPDVLRDAGAARARVVVSTMRRLSDNERLLGVAQMPPVLVRVFSRDEAARVRALGGLPVEEAEIARGPLLEWIERTRPAA